MRYGYSALARELNQRFDISPPLKPQQIDMWNKRRTRNLFMQMFPSPAVRHRKATARGCKPKFEWDLEPVLAWVRGGIPGNVPHTWRYPVERRQRGMATPHGVAELLPENWEQFNADRR